MANLNRPRGFEPYGVLRQTQICVAGGTVYPGDFVKLDNTGRVVTAAVGDTLFGLCMAYGIAGDRIQCSVHPEQLYVGQEHAGSIDAQTDIGNLADILATSADTTYKTSRMEIDDSTLGTGSGGQLVVIDIIQRPNNAGGTNADCVVKINEHQVYGKDAFAGI